MKLKMTATGDAIYTLLYFFFQYSRERNIRQIVGEDSGYSVDFFCEMW